MSNNEPNVTKPYLALTNSATRNTVSTWLETEQMKNYWHEAGHAVIARLTGFRVAWVSVDRKFIEKNPLAMESRCNHGEAVCMTQSSARIQPILAKRKVLNKEEKETIMGYCMHVWAGPNVEERYSPDTFDRSFSENDLAQVAQVLAAAEPNMTKRKKLFHTASRRLDKMLDQEWDKVAQVAYALYRRRTISGAELDAIIWAEKWSTAA